MSHTCPDCGQECYCGGDIDDCNFGESDNCKHSRRDPTCAGHPEWCDDADCSCHQLDDELDDEREAMP